MSLNIDAYHELLPEAVKSFWQGRNTAAVTQQNRGNLDQGNRAAVTAGKNLDGFTEMIRKIIEDNGLSSCEIYTEGRTNLTIPGFFRPTKNWDLLVVSHNQLVACIELKSQVGPSFGNNLNNRVEESLGNSVDVLTAYREGVFGESPKPFVGYFFVLEDCERSRSPVKCSSPHFDVLPEFTGASYASRYEIFCRKIVLENHYDSAALVLTPSSAETTGVSSSLTDFTSGIRFVNTLAAKVAMFASEIKP